MSFVNRTRELAALEAFVNERPPSLIRLYGRRRLGKTELLRHLVERTGGLYLLVDEADRSVVLESLARQIARVQDAPPVPLRDWDQLLDLVGDLSVPFVAFDEFQRLVPTDPSAITRLQDHWDRRMSKHGPAVIVCGSSVGMMQDLTRGKRGPLFGRLGGDLRLRPFDYASVRLLYPDLSEEERVRRYAIFGGTPYYHRFSTDRGLREAIIRSFLVPGAPFLDEPQNLLRLELQTPARYNSILYEVGQGTHLLPELERKIAVRAGRLGPYLKVLRDDLDLLRKDDPVGGVQKRARYVFADPFFDFYYHFIYPRRPLIEKGRIDEVADEIEAGLDAHVGRVFEDVVHQAVLATHGTESQGIPIDVQEIGRWWGRQGEEIDVVALGKHEHIVGEVKWSRTPVGPEDIHRLMERARRVERAKDRPQRPLLVARGGLSDGARRAALEHHALVWGLPDLAAIFDALER